MAHDILLWLVAAQHSQFMQQAELQRVGWLGWLKLDTLVEAAVALMGSCCRNVLQQRRLWQV
jgi:hypothetical protein